MKRSYDRHQEECLKGQHSSSGGIVDCGPAGRPFSLKLPNYPCQLPPGKRETSILWRSNTVKAPGTRQRISVRPQKREP
eukprot:1148499-Pelagomonas_calceolata.AAC.2